MLPDERLIGALVHVLEPWQTVRQVSAFPMPVLLARGDVLQISEDDLEATRNRQGVSCWALEPTEQVAAYGRQMFGHGPWPDDLSVVQPHTPEAAEQADRERRVAYSTLQGDDLDRELSNIRRRLGFGTQANRSRTLAAYKGDANQRGSAA